MVSSLVKCRTESDWSSSAYDSVVRENTEGNEERVHGSAQTLVEACCTSEDFGKRAVEKEVLCKLANIALLCLLSFNNTENVSAEEFLHDIVKFGFVELVD